MNGWILIHKKIQDKAYYLRSQYIHLWIHLLLKANHKEKEFLWNGRVQRLNRGQFITGRTKLSKETGIPQTTIERILDLFEKEQQIGQQKTNKYRLITIVNYDNYQFSDSKRTSSGHLADTTKEYKEVKEVSRSKRTSKNMPWKKQSDNIDDLPSLDVDTGEFSDPSEKEKSAVTPIRKWAEKRRGRKFLKIPQQNTFIKRMLDNGISPDEIFSRYKELDNSEWGKKHGIDFASVFNSFEKRK